MDYLYLLILTTFIDILYYFDRIKVKLFNIKFYD